MKWYIKLFSNLYSAAFATAAVQFGVWLLLFFLLCVVYAVVKLPSNSVTSKDIFLRDFQKYLILAAAVAFIIPTLFSLLLIIGLIRKQFKIIWIWIISALIFFPCIILGLLGSGIYLVIEGALKVGIAAIVLSLLITVPAIHSILITFFYVRSNNKKKSRDEEV